MNTYINWNLICELYEFEKDKFDIIQETLTEELLVNVGWSQNKTVEAHQYKKMWAISVCCDSEVSDKKADKKIQWGYDIIDKHLNSRKV